MLYVGDEFVPFKVIEDTLISAKIKKELIDQKMQKNVPHSSGLLLINVPRGCLHAEHFSS